MTDAQITQFIQTQRPDFLDYYNGTISPGANAGAADPGLLAWARNQFAASPDDTVQFNSWVTSQGGGSGLDLGSLVNPGSSNPTNPPPASNVVIPNVGTPAVSPGGPQGYSQNESGGQTGAYTSVGATNQTQSGEQSQTTQQNQNTTQNQNTVGTQTSANNTTQQNNTQGTETQTGQQQSSGQSTTTTGVNTPFDLSSLVTGQIDAAGQNDASRDAFLRSMVDNGSSAFNSRVDQAVRGSLTGPQMTGAGDSARARASGYAAAQVARNDTDQRLAAAGMLANPGSTTSTVGALTPLFGKTENTSQTGNVNTNTQNLSSQIQNLISQNTGSQTNTTDQNTTGNQNTTGSTNTMDLQSLVSGESQAGTASGQSASQGFGVAPQGQQVKSGGCVVCTAYVSRREMKPGAIRRACRYKQANWARYGTSLTGYLLYGPSIARAVLSSDWFARTFRPVARAILYEEVRLSAPTRLRWRLDAFITHAVFDLLSWPVGLFSTLVGRDTGVRCEKVKAMLIREKLNFSI